MKKVLFFFAMALFAVSSQAQLLWKVSGNGLPKDSYILGTRHDISSSILNMIPGLDIALDNCELFVGETAHDGSDKSGSDDAFDKLLFAPADSTLDKLYTPEQYRFVMEKLGFCLGLKKDLSSTKGLNLKPLALTALMSSPLVVRDFYNFDTANLDNMDRVVRQRAVDKGIPEMGLETHEFQEKMMSEEYLSYLNLPLETQAMVLLEYCKNIDDEIEEFISSYGLYYSQRLDWYEEYSDSYLDKSVIARNNNWIPKLIPAMKEKSCLVAVGIAHLAGKSGLLQQLRDRGYTVEAME